jgi:trimeric autotransporter adhesin
MKKKYFSAISLALFFLLPVIGRAQLNVSTGGGVSVGSTSAPSSGLLVNTGNINLNSATNAFQINGNNILRTSGSNSNLTVGVGAGTNISSGVNNTLIGKDAGINTTTGNTNVFIGMNSGLSNVKNSGNVSVGVNSLYSFNNSFSTWTYNSALGYAALYSNGNGTQNSAFGGFALYNAYGSSNSAFGYYTLHSLTSGSYNVAVGNHAGNSITTGSYNTFLGYNATSNGNYTNCAAIGNGATASGSNKMYFGNANVTGCHNQSNNWSGPSDVRFKFNIQENISGLEFIKKLRPVTYQYNTKQLDEFLRKDMLQMTDSAGNTLLEMDYSKSTSIIHSGFIAQEVEQAAIECGFTFDGVGIPSNENETYSISYGQFVVPLVKAVQEQQLLIEGQQQRIDSLLNVTKNLSDMVVNCCTVGSLKTSGDINSSTEESIKMSGNIDPVSSAKLYQNNPNPFNAQTKIRYHIPQTAQNASIMIFDLQGKLVKTISAGNLGDGEIIINGYELSAGMFVYSLIVDGRIIDTKNMILTQ